MYSLCLDLFFFFYTECTLCNVKENPMFGEEQWKAVAKIIIFWLKNANNLPCSHAVYYVLIISIRR